SRSLHRLEIRIEQQRLQVALIRAGEFERRELQRERAQRLVVRNVDGSATAGLRDLRVVEGKALDRQRTIAAKFSSCTGAQRMRTEVEKDRLRIRLSLRRAHVDSELPILSALARTPAHASAQLVSPAQCPLVIERDGSERGIERPGAAAQRSCEFRCAV